jgi:hypothetical protein
VRWEEVRKAFPGRWLVIEALEAHSADRHRVFDRIAVVEQCADGPGTMKRYRELRRAHPGRELCFVHTDMVELDIVERRWVGVRGRDAARTP